MCLQVAFGVPKEEVLKVFLQIAQLPEAGQAGDKAIPPRSSCRQDQMEMRILLIDSNKDASCRHVGEGCPRRLCLN